MKKPIQDMSLAKCPEAVAPSPRELSEGRDREHSLVGADRAERLVTVMVRLSIRLEATYGHGVRST